MSPARVPGHRVDRGGPAGGQRRADPGRWLDRGHAVVRAWSGRAGGRAVVRARSGWATDVRALLAPGRAAPGVAAPGLVAPRITVEVGARVPGAVVRLAPAVLVALAGQLVGAGPVAGVVLIVLAVTLVVRPALPAVSGVVLAVGLAVMTGPDLLAPPGTAGGTSIGGSAAPAGPWAPVRLGVLLALLDATVRVTALAPHAAWTGWVERAVLARLGTAVLRTQLVVLPVTGLAYAARAAAPGAGGGEVLRVVGIGAVAVLLALLVPRRRRAGGPP